MDYPILLTPDGRYQAILNHAYNIIVEDELLTTANGYETLTFNISNSDKKRYLLSNERIIEVQKRRYVIRLIEDLKTSSNVCTVTCDATWYDLNDGELKTLMTGSGTTIDARTSIAQQLQGTDWEIETVDVSGTRPVHTSQSLETSLYNLRQIKGNFGGDLYFDTARNRVSLLANLGVRHQKIFCYEKNTTSIKRTVDTRNLFTRYTLVGKDSEGNDVTIESINDGKDYVENYSWYDRMGLPRKIKWYKKTDDRYSNKENMKSDMVAWLAGYCQPIVGYELAVSMFELAPELGDYVYVYDKDLNIGGWLRIVSRKKNILNPHLSTVELETTKKTVVDTMVATTNTAQDVQSTIADVITSDGEVKLPPGTEDWIMQYRQGKWKAQPVVNNIVPQGYEKSIMQFIEGEWTAVDAESAALPSGGENQILRHVSGRWVASNEKTFELPPGTEGQILRKVSGNWVASDETVFQLPQGSEGQILRNENGRWVASNETVFELPTGAENEVLQFVNGEWKSSNVLGDINSLLDEINGEVL